MTATRPAGFSYSRRPDARSWAVHAPNGELVCVTLYRRGAVAVVERLNTLTRRAPGRAAQGGAS